MAKAKKRKVPEPWESLYPYSEKYFATYHDSLCLSDAWKDLTPAQCLLYLTCKLQMYKKGDKNQFDEQYRNNPRYFTMNRYKYVNEYGLYSEGNQKGFIRDMNALIEHGFIECVISGQSTRSKSLYRFSDMWTKYGTHDFYISPTVRTASGNKKHFSKKEQ